MVTGVGGAEIPGLKGYVQQKGANGVFYDLPSGEIVEPNWVP